MKEGLVVPPLLTPLASSSSSSNVNNNPAIDSLRAQYLNLLQHGHAHPEEHRDNIAKLRRLVLLEGVPPETDEEINERTKGQLGKCSLRGMIWMVLLGVRNVDSERYAQLLAKGPSNQYQKVRNDIGRTFMNDASFEQSVAQDKLSRSLNAFVHCCTERGSPMGYVQGANLLLGAFLYVQPEVDAFYTFQTLAFEHCSLYFYPDINGVLQGLKVLDWILELVDPDLYSHLRSRSYYPELLTHTILSMGAGTPPLSELLILWDFYFAFGVHMNVICTVAQLVLMRDTLLAHPSPCSLFRSLPDLEIGRAHV